MQPQSQQPHGQQPQVRQLPAPSAQPNQQPPQFPLRSSDWQRPLPDRSLSSHPFINRTAQYLRSARLLYTCYGVLGHLTRNCTGEELSGWEQFYLRGVLREVLQSQPRSVRSNLANVASAPRDWSSLLTPQSQQYQRPQSSPSEPPFQYNANRAAPSSANVNPNTPTYDAPQLELEDLQGANVGSLHVELVRSFESRYAEHKELKKKPQEVVNSFYRDQKRLRQARDDISDEWAGETQVVNRPAPALSQPAKLPDNNRPILSADRHRRHHRMRRSASTEHVPRAAYQPPTVEDIPEIITEDIVDEEALQETTHQQARSEAEVTVQAPQTSVQAEPLIPAIQLRVQESGIRRRP